MQMMRTFTDLCVTRGADRELQGYQAVDIPQVVEEVHNYHAWVKVKLPLIEND